MSTLIIIPTYNEKNNILPITKGVLTALPHAHILFVDDNSPDGTQEVIGSLEEKEKRVFLLARKSKEGLGRAYVAGFLWALERNYTYIFEMDADFSHHPRYLPEMENALKSNLCDFIIGSRYIQGGNVKNWDIKRILISRTASLYTRMLSSMPIKDPTAGFVGYHSRVLQAIDLQGLEFVGYAFQIEMKYIAWQKKFRYLEIPINFVDRKEGKSKMNLSIVNEGIKGVLKLRYNTFKGKYK